MQLTRGTLTTGMLLFGLYAMGQDTSKINLDDIEISFMGSYYEQDGNHSAVTGGTGTEQLTNVAPSVAIVIPLDTMNTLTVDAAVDFYSSASSDNINNPFLLSNHVSSASAHDSRAYGTVGYKHKNSITGVTWGGFIGASNEYDVSSVSGGMSILKESKDHNRSISAKASYYYDNWSLIYPTELRNGDVQHLNTDIRQSLNLSITGSTVINTRMNMALTADLISQQGLLSTPYHRVYFADSPEVKVEQLPSSRLKTPIGLRFNYHATDFMLVKTFYRYYMDNWGMTGHTIKVELPLKLSQAFRVYPFYRYSTQTAVDYFAPYAQHTSDATYFTSDYDISALSSEKIGFGFSYEPLYGIGRMKASKGTAALFKSIDFRYATYSRSDGLTANVFSIGLKFNITGRKK